MAANAYTDKSIQSLKADRDRLRTRPTQFIPSTYADGALHIIFEIVDNSIDELSIKDAVGKNLTVIFDIKTKECTVIDDGRGIPHGALLDALTVLNTSGKFNNTEETAYTYSGGTFGVGAKCATYLSKQAEVTSMRDGKSLTYKFKDGLLTDTIRGKTKEHGTIFKFTIDPKIIDINSVTPEMIRDRVHEKSYCFPDIKMSVIFLENGKEVKTIIYEGNTLLDLVKRMKPDTEIVEINDTRKVKTLRNFTDDDITEVKVIVDAALAFSEKALDADTDSMIVSYANSIKTYDGGQHVEGLKQGVIKFFKEVIIPKASKRDKDLPITPSDITSGLCGMVSVKLSKPEFSAQHKSRLSNQEVKYAVRDAVYDTLCQQKNSVINAMGDFVRRVTRGRISAKKTRKKDVDNAFSNERPAKYDPIICNMNTTSMELILCEGDSAASLASKARDPYNQGIYSVMKPKNIYDANSETIVHGARSVFNDLMDICGIEPGKKCDPSKSSIQRILMLTDGDVDGDGIAITVICLLAKHCKPMIDAGMVGRILPPAYSFPTKSGKKRFVRSKREFFDLIMEQFIKEVTVAIDGKELKNDKLYEFLSQNFEYDQKLEKLANRYCCEPKFMEYIAWKYHGTTKDQKRSYWQAALKPYSEIRVLMESGTLVIDGDLPGYDYVNLALDENFERHVNKFKAIQAANSKITGYSINGEKGKTLYEVMHMFRQYMPKGVKRFKGLGELDSKDMHDLCMDQDKRTVIIFKFKNYEEDMRKIDVIMSSKAEAAAARAELMTNITLSDLDFDT